MGKLSMIDRYLWRERGPNAIRKYVVLGNYLMTIWIRRHCVTFIHESDITIPVCLWEAL